MTFSPQVSGDRVVWYGLDLAATATRSTPGNSAMPRPLTSATTDGRRNPRFPATGSCGQRTQRSRSTPGRSETPLPPTSATTAAPTTAPPDLGRPGRVAGLGRHRLGDLHLEGRGRRTHQHQQQQRRGRLQAPGSPATGSCGPAVTAKTRRSTPGRSGTPRPPTSVQRRRQGRRAPRSPATGSCGTTSDGIAYEIYTWKVGDAAPPTSAMTTARTTRTRPRSPAIGRLDGRRCQADREIYTAKIDSRGAASDSSAARRHPEDVGPRRRVSRVRCHGDRQRRRDLAQVLRGRDRDHVSPHFPVGLAQVRCVATDAAGNTRWRLHGHRDLRGPTAPPPSTPTPPVITPPGTTTPTATKTRVALSHPRRPQDDEEVAVLHRLRVLKPSHAAGTKPVWVYKYKKVAGKWHSYGYVKATAYNYGSTPATRSR